MEHQRIGFCDELRGFAAIIVMLSHFTIGFNALHGFLYNPLTSDDIFPSWFLRLLPIDGAFGVAIFFLISGFIIPFSLQKRSAFKFLQARIIRIYPVYVVSALITTLLGLVLFDFDFQKIIIFIKSITLFRDWLGGPAVDGVLWTLEVEIKFYLYIALMLPILRSKPIIVIIIPLIIVVFFIFLLKIHPSYPIESTFQGYRTVLNVVLYDFGFLSYMNIGLIIYLYHVGKFNKSWSMMLILFSLIVCLIFIKERYQSNNLVLEIYLFALVVFLFFYKFGIFFKIGFSGFFAKISYPLYAVHSTLGFVLLSLFIFKFNIYPILSLFCVIGIVTYVAYVIHKLVELPSIKKSSALQ